MKIWRAIACYIATLQVFCVWGMRNLSKKLKALKSMRLHMGRILEDRVVLRYLDHWISGEK